MSESNATSSSQIVVGMYAFTTPDPMRLANFWGKLMDLPLAEGASPELAMLNLDHDHGPITWLFQRSTEPTRPGQAPLGLDINIQGDDWKQAADRAEALGATRVAERELNGAHWIEMRDPDGSAFRVFARRPQ